jgi:1-acyl-sn-glycerol-3-phosphate acyltransferase
MGRSFLFSQTISTSSLRGLMRWLAYLVTRFLCRVILGAVTRTSILHRERSARRGAFILVANHISHFDPPFLTAASRRKIDWMAMAEMFENRLAAAWLRANDTFPVDRFQTDRAAVRIALRRLERGHVVGVFPEGGIRDGVHSILEAAPLPPGVAGLAQLSGAPVMPCVIIGSDQLYAHRNWLPLRRARAWVAFGEPMQFSGKGKAARSQFENEVLSALRALYAELQAHFHLTADDLPQPPTRRKGRA